MSFVQNFPFFTIILCLLCAVSTFVAGDKWGRRLSVALLCVSVALNASVLWFCASNNMSYSYMMGHYPAPWGNEIMAGVMEPLMATLFSVVMLCSVLGGMGHIMADVQDHRKVYWINVDMTLVSLLALCYTNDIFTGYVFIEICTIGSCVLLSAKQNGRTLIASARYMIFALIGSGLFLIGVVLTYSVTGHLLFPQLHEAVAAVWADGRYTFSMTAAIGLMTAGIAIKSGLFPFHFWMPDTYGQATPASSGILSGVVSKGYIFLLIKIIYRAVGIEVFTESGIQAVLLVFGIGGMIVGSISAIRTKRLTTMVAYSSAAQIGYIYMGLGMGTDAALLAAILHIFAHSLTKPMLFLAGADLADASGGENEFHALRGAGHRDVMAGVLFTAGSLSMVGIPLFIGFIPKLHFASAAFDMTWQQWPVLLGLAISTVLNVGYFLYTSMVLWLPEKEGMGYTREKRCPCHYVPAVVLLIIAMAIGIYSAPLTRLIEQGLALFVSY